LLTAFPYYMFYVFPSLLVDFTNGYFDKRRNGFL
jgi:hypothetical protein